MGQTKKGIDISAAEVAGALIRLRRKELKTRKTFELADLEVIANKCTDCKARKAKQKAYDDSGFDTRQRECVKIQERNGSTTARLNYEAKHGKGSLDKENGRPKLKVHASAPKRKKDPSTLAPWAQELANRRNKPPKAPQESIDVIPLSGDLLALFRDP